MICLGLSILWIVIKCLWKLSISIEKKNLSQDCLASKKKKNKNLLAYINVIMSPWVPPYIEEVSAPTGIPFLQKKMSALGPSQLV